ncbi:helix-turn-helix domain-containing protein, partial [Plesiomonas shigelloides]
KTAHILNVILPKPIKTGQKETHFIRNEIPLSSYFFKEMNDTSINVRIEPSEKTSAIVYLLSFFYCHIGFHDSITRSITNNLSDKVYGIVSSDNDSKWTLPMCAKALYMSSSTLKRKLMQEGKTFSEIYQDVKMNKSITLLMTTSKSIASIANECGFSSSASFSTAFKKKHGISPLKLMKKINKS